MTRAIIVLIFWLLASGFSAYAQQPAQVIGPVTPGNVPAFNSTTIIKDSGIPAAGIPGNILNIQTANYTVANSDCGKTIQAGTGSTGFFTITVPSVSGFPATCVVTITDGDTARGKAIAGLGTIGCSSRTLIWPSQTCQIGIVNGAWATLSRPGRYRPFSGDNIQFFTDFTNGTDGVGATDGLAPGAAAFKSAEYCFLNAADQIDYNASSQTTVLCNMAAATADTQGMHVPIHALDGAQGGAAMQVVGASLSITGAVSNSGSCEITVSSTSTYHTNDIVSVYGVNGATGCNGTWKAVVTDPTHLSLQGAVFGGAYSGGGTVTNGSSFNVSALNDVDCYFGTVIQFSNILWKGAQNGLGVHWGCKVYLQPGNVFDAISASDIAIDSMGQIHVTGDIGISASAANAFLLVSTLGLFVGDQSYNINFVPSSTVSFAALGFAFAQTQGQANFGGATINLNSSTVTGPKCSAVSLGAVFSNTGSANTYFPGNSNCTALTGGVVDGATGASCPSGVTAGTVVVVNGVVTHC